MNSIVNLLHKKNLIKKEIPNQSTIDSLSFNEIETIGSEIEEIIKSEIKPSKNSISTHTASSGLGGGTNECNSLSCRLDSVNRLSRFALMYSDKVYIQSYFTKYSDDVVFYDLDFLRETFFNDISLILKLSPLIDNGFIDFYCPNTETCFTCQATTWLGRDAGKKFDKAYKQLKQKYLDNMSIEASIDYDELEFSIYGPKPFFLHPYYEYPYEIPPSLMKRPTILKKIEHGEKVKFSKTLIKDLGYHLHYAHRIVSDAISGITASRTYNNCFLSENNLHIDFLNSLQPLSKIAERNKIAEKYLSTIVPFVADVELKNILTIRKREEESFLQFRKALNEAIDSFLSSSEIITEKDAKDIYSEIIAPSIANLNVKIKQAKKDLIVNTYRPLIALSGVISFGVLAGLFPADTFEVVKALGLFKFGTDFVTNLMALGDSEKKIKSDQFYFLWKIKKMVQS